MAWSLKFLSVALLLPTLVLGGAEVVGRDTELDVAGDDIPDAQLYKMNTPGNAEFGAMPLDARSLVDSWLGKRAECVNAGYSPCSSRLKPSLLSSSLIVRGECCTNGNYCSPGNKCYILRGIRKCCTDSKCTAYVTNGVTSTASGASQTAASPKATTTKTTDDSTEATITGYGSSLPTGVLVGSYYVWTRTWYYYSYWWSTTIFIETTKLVSTSTRVTTTTHYTARTTDSERASSSFVSWYSAWQTPTPQEANLPPSPTGTLSELAPTSSRASTAQGAIATQSGNAPSGSSHMKPSFGLTWVVAAFMFLGPGVLMVWL
ncbi:uncharacterized protein BP5553_01660 [Venustampulla echinocandica]|uniref:Uncharacterized protein n=1 Tax=Venustampulla echinocandica TaxID=2656787 RepID=A0A370U1P6_9HELO|nr:uncharacterized protein BP5553_01660 [Venustampulla echinocandica]RDL41681.1 hypothetical protein BP5553_01660 [Venustampulla echinocandica]